MKAAAVIVAGGSGKRFGSATPKQFLNLLNKPVFMWSVEAFLSVSAFKKIIVVVPSGTTDSLSKKYGNKNIVFTPGGKERFDSVKAGLAFLDSDTGFVAVHDGARPLISKKDIISVLNKAKYSYAAIAAEKTKDTIKTVKNGYISSTLERSALWNAQTPQIFEKNLLLKAYKKKISANTTDDAQLVEKLKYKVAVVETKYPNFKITNPGDLEAAAEELRKRNK